MFSEFDKWPLILQILAGLGAVGMGAFMYFKTKKEPVPAVTPIDVELRALRADLVLGIEAVKTSVNGQIEKHIERSEEHWAAVLERIHNIEGDVKVLFDRHERNPERPRGR